MDHHFWMDVLGGDPSVVGSTIRLNREAFDVVGVTKPEFRGHVPVLVLDLRVLGFALALTLGTGLIFGLLPAVQATREVAPSISLAPVIEMTTLTRMGVLPQRIAAGLSSLMGLLALILSGMGIYGVIAPTVSRRTREIGIRMALGAEKKSILRLVVVGGLRLAAPGLVVGVLMALGLGKVLQAFLLGLSPADPATLLGVAFTLLGMVVLATIVPARRAAGVQPAEALRYE